MSQPRPVTLLTAALLVAGCGAGATPAAPVTVTVTQTSPNASASTTSREPVPATSTPGTSTPGSPTPDTPTPSIGSSFDTYPAGYQLAFVREIVQVEGQWAARLDPVTLCTGDSTDAACAEVVKHLETEYEIRNVSTRLYTVPLTSTATVRRLASGEPGDYVETPPAAATYPVSDTQSFLVEVHLDDQGQLTDITEWWHP